MKMKPAKSLLKESLKFQQRRCISYKNCICSQQRLRSAWACTHSKQKLRRSSKEGHLADQRKAMTLISLRICAG